MKRPIVYMSIAYILGVVSFKLNAITVSSIITVLWMIFLYKRTKELIVVSICIFFILGIFRMNFVSNENGIEIHNKTNIVIAGQVENIKSIDEKLNRILISTNKGKFNVYAYYDKILNYHDKIKVKGKFYQYQEVKNKGEFNQKLYMDIRNIKGKIYGSILDVQSSKYDYNIGIDNFKNKLLEISEKTLPEKEMSVFNSIILGEKSYIDEEVKEKYKAAGIAHIIAISGMHIFLIVLILYKLLEFLKVNKRWGAFGIIAFLLIYLIITNASVSTVRAVVMAIVILAGNIIRRDSEKYSSISFAALLLLVYQPLYIYDVGFLLSFGAVLALVTSEKIINKKIKYIPKWISTILIATIMINIWITPILVYNFYEISVYSLIANLFVLPLMSVLVGMSFLGLILGLINLKLCMVVMTFVKYILVYFEGIATTISNLPYSKILIGSIDTYRIIVYYSFLTLIVLCNNSKFKARERTRTYVIDVVFVFIIMFFFIPQYMNELEITMLDVGQGDSIVIHSKNEKTIVIDGGGERGRDKDSDNTGKRILSPYLKYKGENKVDIVIVTHPDYDHIKGIIELVDLMDVEKIILPIGKINSDDLQIQLIEKAKKKKIEVLYFGAGDSFEIDNIKFKCLYPHSDVDETAEINNNYSLVFEMEYKDKKLLFTGDIEKEDEKILLERTELSDVDILKVAHHGSKTSTIESFLKRTNPEVAIISAGNSVYKHPHEEVLGRLSKQNIETYVTKKTGAIYIKYLLGKFYIDTQK